MDNSTQNVQPQSDGLVIDFGRLLNALISNVWRIGIVVLLCGMLAMLGSTLLLTPMYSASVSFYVNNKYDVGNNSNNQNTSLSSGDIVTSKNLVNTYIVVLKTRDTLLDVIDYADLDRSYSELSGMISAASVDGTEIFRVTVSSEDPKEAEVIANAIAHVVPDRIGSIIKGSSAEVVDHAVVPNSPYSPNHTKNTLLGLLIGFVASALVVILIEIFDVTIRNEDDIKNYCRYPVLASVPDMLNVSEKGYYNKYYYKNYYHKRSYYGPKGHNEGAATETAINLIGDNIGFTASESYKLLRTKLQYSFADDQKCHVIAVSSSIAGEGKSLSSINLAYNLAQLNKNVLLIDCDMRRPSLAKKMSLTKFPGLSEYLTGLINMSELFQEYSNGPEQVPIYVITAGNTPPNPVELMNSEKMARTIAALRERFDYIILDMPPVGDVSDALVSTQIADGILLIVRQNFGTRIALQDAIQQFEFVNARILGLVFNCVNNKTGRYQSKKYGRYYSYRYGYRRGYRYAYHHTYAEDVPAVGQPAENSKKKKSQKKK